MDVFGYIVIILLVKLAIGLLMFSGSNDKRDIPKEYRRKQEEAWKRAEIIQRIEKQEANSY